MYLVISNRGVDVIDCVDLILSSIQRAAIADLYLFFDLLMA